MTPRLGFVGAGWIGASRMRDVVAAGAAVAAVVADPDTDAAEKAAADVGCDTVAATLDEALAHDLDGVVLATPSALHAQQSLQALSDGVAVFCQKPLGRTAGECAAVVDAARDADLLLGVDLSYRHAAAFAAATRVVRAGEIGQVYAADLVFHNAYGPDKAWFTDPALAGGGCVIDLGTHLIDMALQSLETSVVDVEAQLFTRGAPLADPSSSVEDYAVAQLRTDSGAVVRLACSWFLPLGTDAVIEAHFHGSAGGVSVRNRNGSFYDFTCDRYAGRDATRLVDPPDEWAGRALIAWAAALSDGGRFDPGVASVVQVASTIDRIYGRST
jgi:predicted dehydrogenase